MHKSGRAFFLDQTSVAQTRNWLDGQWHVDQRVKESGGDDLESIDESRSRPRRPSPSHPLRPTFTHFSTTCVGWEDMSRLLLPALRVACASRCEDPLPTLHDRVEAQRPLNTLRYMYYHMRCGIVTVIRQSRVVLFAPFANEFYRNTWARQACFAAGQCISDFGATRTYDEAKAKVWAPPLRNCASTRLEDPTTWWANAGVVCNEPHPQVWGDGLVDVLYRALERTCRRHAMPDCIVFINRRDHPQLARDTCYDSQPFIWKGGHSPRLSRERYRPSEHCGVLSFYGGPGFADLLMPTQEDWALAQEARVSDKGGDGRAPREAKTTWSQRKPVAVWRGSATGSGQRIKLAQLSWQHQRTARRDRVPIIIDAQIMQWSRRDFIDNGVVYYLDPRSKDLPRKGRRMTYAEQYAFRYTIYISGHAAASRLGTLFASESLVLYIDAPESGPFRQWLDNYIVRAEWTSNDRDLDPLDKRVSRAHVVPVRSDLSNLLDAIRWCRENDRAARSIARRGTAELAERLICAPGALEDEFARVLRAAADQSPPPSATQWVWDTRVFAADAGRWE